jgi:hypothetical protein
MARARVLAVVLVALAGAIEPAASLAAPAPPVPAIDQYIEQIPTAEGPIAPTAQESSRPLPADVGREVEEQGGADAGPLTAIATSSRYGAPQRRPAPAPDPEEATAPTREEPAPAEQPAAEAIEATDAPALPRDPRLVGLLLALGASVVAVAGYEVVRRRR